MPVGSPAPQIEPRHAHVVCGEAIMCLLFHFTEIMPRGTRATSTSSAGPNHPGTSLLAGCG
eukprot:978644-Lingulodinium_polyedra.AAC.1